MPAIKYSIIVSSFRQLPAIGLIIKQLLLEVNIQVYYIKYLREKHLLVYSVILSALQFGTEYFCLGEFYCCFFIVNVQRQTT